jgi:hypothetical protein
MGMRKIGTGGEDGGRAAKSKDLGEYPGLCFLPREWFAGMSVPGTSRVLTSQVGRRLAAGGLAKPRTCSDDLNADVQR